MTDHPVQLVVDDDLGRNRLTVLFRLILAIPHLVWVLLWAIAAISAAIANWFATLVIGQPPDALHRFLSAYVRYVAHLNAYLYLAANPYPGFLGERDSYPVDIDLPAPGPQSRWKTLLRLILVLPALFVSGTLGGLGPEFRVPSRHQNGGGAYIAFGGALAGVGAFLGWFACLALGRMPRGLRDANAYSVGYGAHALAYLLLVTDRYPNADPAAMLTTVEPPSLHLVRLAGHDDLRRSRVLVIFRLPLAVPHLVWLLLWSVLAFLAVILNWFVTLAIGRPPRFLHRFLSAYVRYSLHVWSFIYLAANPFPGFVGAAGSYPLDVDLPGPERQRRWVTLFRLPLAVPALIVNWALGISLFVSAVLTWFVALLTGTAPRGLRNLMAYALRYQAQLNAYVYLVTDAYPHASPLEGAEPEPEPEPPSPDEGAPPWPIEAL